MSIDAPIIVVGGGIAGLSAALAAAPAPVLLLTRRPGAVGAASTLAQGGIAAARAESRIHRVAGCDEIGRASCRERV